MTIKDDAYFMRIALQEAKKAYLKDDVPIGAVIVRDGKIIARAHNEKEYRSSAIRHAEILAMDKASRKIGNWWLEGCVLYVTLEPCAMCAGAAVNTRLEKVVYGAKNERFGFMGSVANLSEDYKVNHKVQTVGGVLEDACSSLLTAFFREKREQKRKIKII